MTESAPPRRNAPGASALEMLVSELLGAVPEVRDSLVAVADAALDAARGLIDAADRALHGTDDDSESPR